ncbi:MAG: ATP-binding protein, partial [Candidatus Eremiobacterota bacterium]
MARDPYRYFRIEAVDLLEQMGQGALDLERDPTPDRVSRLLRLAHTLKGAARVVKAREIADRAHAIEDILSPHRESADLPRGSVSAVLANLDEISHLVEALSSPPRATPEPGPPAEDPGRALRADMADLDALLEDITQVQTCVGTLRRRVARAERVRHVVDLLAEQTGTSPRTRSILEELRSLLNELDRSLTFGVDQVDRELQQVREGAERLLLTPVSTLFTLLARAVRDAAQHQGKRVEFRGTGGDVRLDAQVLAAAQGALVQVVRNAVAHGIESEEERLRASKPAIGQVTLEVVRRGRRALFVCQDDGRGIDLEAVRRAARQRGMAAEEAGRLGTEELLRLLLQGGITTSGTVSEVAGRGIGLDVVREAVGRLGGQVRVETVAGRCTRVELDLPLSMSALHALVVACRPCTALIPLESVQSTLRLHPEQILRTADSESVLHEGASLPFLALERILSPGAIPNQHRPWSAVIVQGARGRRAAVGVDRLLGTAQTVLR